MLYFLNGFSVYAQEKIHIKLVLEQLEQIYQVKFTYADDVLDQVFVVPTNELSTIDQHLEFLEAQTLVRFSKTTPPFIAIQQRNDLIKLCGFIKDYADDGFLQGATIQIHNQATITNQDGYFELYLKPENQKTLKIDFLGYDTLTVAPDINENNTCSTFYLNQKEEILEAIFLQDYLTKGIEKSVDGSFEMDFSDFGLVPGQIESDVLQTIQALPGIQSVDETVSNINIRGGTHDQNLITWDGIKMYQSGHFFGLISIFNPNITDHAQLIKNGTHARHGDGISGSILMRSQEKITKELRLSAGLNLINADVFTDIPLGQRSSLQISGRKSLSQFIETTPTYTEYYQRIAQDTELESDQQSRASDVSFDFYDTNLRWNYIISDKDRLRANFLLIANELIFTENATTISRKSSIDQNSIAGGVWYQRNWNDNLTTEVQVYETDYNLRSINSNLLQRFRFLQKNVVSETGIKISAVKTISKKLQLTSGYDFIETGITNLNDIDDPLYRDKKRRVLRNHAVYSQVGYTSGNGKTSANLGARYTYIPRLSFHRVEPRLSVNHKFNKQFTLEVLGEFKHQSTSQIINLQDDFLGIEKRRWILSNETDVPIIRSRQVSLGLQYDNKGWLVSGEGYSKKVTDITARSQNFKNQYKGLLATGAYTVNGLDFLINKRFRKLSSWMSYSLAKNTYDFDSFEIGDFSNNIDIRHTVTLGTSYSVKALKVSGGIKYNSGLPTTTINSDSVDENNSIDFSSPNAERLKNYLRLDLSATYDVMLGKRTKLHTGIALINLSNTQNEIDRYYELNSDQRPMPTSKYALGFTPNAVVRIIF
ncbi:TonB-dependent receptor [Aquimarina intermedia]|uniref:TonB-dependent receptor n=1 Tax=Aquimarina intermedia TaxID=350814 RepID=UPI0011E7DC94|nr:carboxypeptidase-like regulatory domain-containing protein [Aquimarina intermedia]